MRLSSHRDTCCKESHSSSQAISILYSGFFSTLMSTLKNIRYFREGHLPSLWLSQFRLKSNRFNGDVVHQVCLLLCCEVVSILSTVGLLLLLLPFATFPLCPSTRTLLSKYIADVFFALSKSQRKNPTQFRDIFIRHCILLNKKGNLSTVSFKKLNK